MEQEHRRGLGSRKRSFGKYPARGLESPAYDASEEDNDHDVSDAASQSSLPATSARRSLKPPPHSRPIPYQRHHLAASVTSDSDGVDSPTYDGDIESSATAGPDSLHSGSGSSRPYHHHHHHHHSSSTSTLNTPATPAFPSTDTTSDFVMTPHEESAPQLTALSPQLEPLVPKQTAQAFNPAALTPDDIQAFVRKAIEGESWRKYKINEPPTNRPVRVYADGVYDLFHFGHALQLRQAKLSFPNVYLLVGVCSDELVKEHKSKCVMTHAERLEGARHCRWVDQVVPEAPWILDQAFIDKYQIDYVAHDEDPYVAEGHEDVYTIVKSQGKFIPTRRTPGVSTSELLERIVSGYRRRDFDEKLHKMGRDELRAEGSDYDDSRSGSPVHGASAK